MLISKLLSCCICSAVSQVEHWLEKLHDKRHSLDIDCHERKIMLEKRLTITLLVTDLNLLENILSERRGSLDRVKNCLGDSRYECCKLTEANANLVTEAKDIRDQALRVVKATEQLVLTKGYMEEDYKLKAYKSLELATEYLEELDRREQLLDAAMKFFESAEKVSVGYLYDLRWPLFFNLNFFSTLLLIYFKFIAGVRQNNSLESVRFLCIINKLTVFQFH